MNLFKLEKLKIDAYPSSARNMGEKKGTFEVMFNPESYSQKYSVAYGKFKVLGSRSQTVDYQRTRPSELKLKLVLDGNGVDSYGLINLFGQKSVGDRLKDFLTLTYGVNGDIHEPNYLVITWGSDLSVPCRLSSVDVNFTSFDRDGSPLRAELDTLFVSDPDAKRLDRDLHLRSPDLTRRVVVKAGDTLPFLSQQIYGSPEHYLLVASANGLDNFRDLSPGLELSFPPLPTSAGIPTT